MNIVKAKEIFVRYYSTLPIAVKQAVNFTLENWNEMKTTPIESAQFTFTAADAKSFLQNLPALPTDARKEDKTFISKLNLAVSSLRNNLDVWLGLENLPHEEWRDVIERQ